MKRADAWSIVALVVGVVVQTPGVLIGQVFWSHDLRHHHHPWRDWAAGRWASGELPLWAGDVGGGFPLMADGQAGVFYPPNIVLGLLLTSAHALTVSIVLHGVLAAVGVFWLCRKLGRTHEAAVLAGLAYALSGFVVAHVTYAGFHAVAAWLPWLIGVTLSLRTSRQSGLFALITALCLTAGHPQAAVIALATAALVWLTRRPGSFWLALGGAAIGVFGATPQLVASWELTGFSEREGGVVPGFANIGSLPPWELPNLAFPRFWGWERPADIALTYTHKGAAYFGSGENHWEDCLYLGWPVILLVLLSWRAPRLWKALATGGLVLALGKYTPAWWILQQIPPFDHFRFPARFGMVATLGFAVLASWALDHVDRVRLERLALGAIGILVLGGVVGWGALALVPPEAVPLEAVRAQAIHEGLGYDMTWGLLLPIGSLIALFLLSRFSGQRFSRAVVVVLFLDLSIGLAGYNPTVPAATVQDPGGFDELKDTPWRVATVDRVQPTELDKRLLASSLGLLWGTRDVIVMSPLRMPRHEELLAQAGLDVGLDHGVVQARRLEENLDVARRFAIRWYLTVHELDHPDLELIRDEAGVRLYEDRAPRPMLWTSSEHAADPLTFSDEEHSWRVTVREPSRLVHSETWYPGWEVTLDGEPAELEREGDHQAVQVPAGIHEVAFRYAPGWRWTWILWALVWPIGLGLVVGRRRMTRMS
ncbi:MAG: YfhO family protein [Proteobacteria bacterium]|nr:YfhO family protein [Pseudomonadota bacterium]MCP4921016.1 YfhO family protein [Pseudomonadota bacterium]